MSQSRWLHSFKHISYMRLILTMLPAFCFQPMFTQAYELNSAKVTEDSGVFQIEMTAVFNAPAAYIKQVLTDYTHFYRLSSSIIESEVLLSDPTGATQVRTKVLACVSMFCREVERVDAIQTLASGDLQADIVPELSEFRSGQATWKITAMGNKSLLLYQATLEPDFYIPPVIGVPAISNSLKDEFIATFERIERIASIKAERDWTEDYTVANVSFDKSQLPCSKKRNVEKR